MKNVKFSLISLTLFLMILSSCTTVPAEMDESMSEESFFKNAQNAMDEDNYDIALYYYEIYLVRYPENHAKTIAAEYERALIYYKSKEYDYSRSLFIQVLDKYENSPFAVMYPERYKILSEKILQQIDEKLHPSPKIKESTEV
jgi:outer membrane protein assembly factor BamD (BamD/ComL family)